MTRVTTFQQKKRLATPISMVTCYDAWSAKILNNTDIDSLLVGDSLAVVMHGFESTVHATVEMMALHVAAVARGAPDKFIIADMPFLSCSKGRQVALDAVETLIQAGAHAVKIEGADHQLDVVRRIVEAGVPVMGHLGLTPQSVHKLGGHKVQGRDDAGSDRIVSGAEALAAAGCFAIVLECVPRSLGERISSALDIPTIGIGAGAGTDGQVLVLHDLLGTDPGFSPRFLRRYADAHSLINDAVQAFHQDVIGRDYPAVQESFG